MKYDGLAKEIIKNVGGKENVIDVVHCITRLRFRLKDEGKAETAVLKAMDGVVTVIQSGGQYQVVIGNQVSEVYAAVKDALGGKTASEEEGETNGKKGLLNQFIDIVSSLFTPILGILAATGMIKGLSGMLLALGLLTKDSGTFQLLYIIGDSMFYFLPVYLGFTAARKFKMNEFVGMTIGACLVYPTLTGIMGKEPLFRILEGTILESAVHIKFLGIPVLLMQYSSSVIPVILAVFFAAKLEKILNKMIPAVVKGFLTPCLTLLVIVPATFLLIGPAATWMSQLIGAATMYVYHISPVAAGFLLGGLWQIMVMFGLHWGMAPIGLNNLVTYGYDAVTVLKSATPIVTACVVLAVSLRTRDKKLKAICYPACISSLFGVSEPSIYGVTLPLKRPFIITLLCSAAGGAIMGVFQTKAYMAGGMGIFSFPSYINPQTGMDSGFYGYFISIIAAGGLGFLLTWFFGLSKDDLNQKKEETAAFDDAVFKKEETAPYTDDAAPKEETAASADDGTLKKDETITDAGIPKEGQSLAVIVASPVKGRVIPLSEVKDEAFSSGALGKGVAVIPTEGKLKAPVDGQVSALFPTLHAVGITSRSGVEILIHIGMDTVKVIGEGFTAYVKQGDTVTQGQLLIEFDIEKIQREGYLVTTPVIISNCENDQEVTVLPGANTSYGDGLLQVIKQA